MGFLPREGLPEGEALTYGIVPLEKFYHGISSRAGLVYGTSGGTFAKWHTFRGGGGLGGKNSHIRQLATEGVATFSVTFYQEHMITKNVFAQSCTEQEN